MRLIVAQGGVAVALCLTGCRSDSQPPPPEPLELTEVGVGIDRHIRPEDDSRAKTHVDLLLGVLPSDFPSDFWVYEPSAVVDFSALESDERWVQLKVRQELEVVHERLVRRLHADGWSGGPFEGQAATFSKSERTVTVTSEEDQGEVLLLIDYLDY